MGSLESAAGIRPVDKHSARFVSLGCENELDAITLPSDINKLPEELPPIIRR